MDTPAASTDRQPSVETESVFRALADHTRQKLLQLLLKEELSVSELVTILDLPQSTVSRHLRVLRQTGLASDRRAGTAVLYTAFLGGADDDVRHLVLTWIKARPLAQGLQERLDRTLRRREDEAIDFFERLGNRWDDLRTAAFGEAFATEAFLSLLPREWIVADLGTGTGYLLPALAEHFSRVIAIEQAPAMLECARQRIASRAMTNVEFHLSNVGTLPINDACCDLALSCLVLHHMPAPATALAEMLRVIRPGGRALIVEQYTHDNHEFFETMQDHWSGFEPAALAERLETVGFAQIHHHRLTSAQSKSGRPGAPGLFVMSACRPEQQDDQGERNTN